MKKQEAGGKIPSSFRDPSGFLFHKNNTTYRQVNTTYRKHYDQLMNSGLYEKLVEDRLLIPHLEADVASPEPEKAYKIIKPEEIPFISYPYEWCFSQLKDAALTTLEIQRKSLEHGMTLKDCSAYNIQFKKGRPVLIDTLSFEKYVEGRPWAAYRQFCQHFLGPLALMSCRDVRLNQLLRIYIDGIPLDLASSLLPQRTRLKFSLLSHIHLHARTQKKYEDKQVNLREQKVSRTSFLGLVDSLESAVKGLKWQPEGTEWAEYYKDTNYPDEALLEKKKVVGGFLDEVKPRVVWDLGANTGIFSRIAGDRGILAISFDVDPACVEKNYLECKEKAGENILPLLLDLTNPSPNTGWENRERMSLTERGPADTVLALALIHHLAISNNLPFNKIAGFLRDICSSLIIEFVPKNDSQVQRLLATREDIFPDYTQQSFEDNFKEHFTINDSVRIKDTERTLYLLEKKS